MFAQATQVEMHRRFLASRDNLRQTWNDANLSHRTMMALADTIERYLPGWLQIGQIDTFLQLADQFDRQYRSIGQALAWLDILETGHERGQVSFRPSVTKPGDIDVAIDQDTVPPVPAALQSTTQITTLGGAPVLVFAGILAGIGILKIGTDYLTEMEKTERKRIEFLTSKLLLESDAAESTKMRVAGLMKDWENAEPAEQGIIETAGTALKWAAIIGVSFAGLDLLLRFLKWRSESKAQD